MKTPESNYEVALDALDKGIAAIPIVSGTKRPAVKWKKWQTRLPTPELLRRWFVVWRNIAIVTTGMVVFDCDDPEKADLVLAACGETPHKVKTPRGVHLGYRKRKGVALANQVRVKGLAIDIRTDGGLEIIPHSETEHGRYEWLPGCGLRRVSELPVAKIGWTRQRTRKRMRQVAISHVAVSVVGGADELLRRARLYLGKIEPAVSGEGGHNKTFGVACRMARFVNFDAEMLWLLLLEYNARCQPPWSEKELRHKWTDALKTSR